MQLKALARALGMLILLLPPAAFATVTPYPPYPGAVPSDSYEVSVNGQPVFVHRFLTYDQFNWMDYSSFSMTEKVHVTVTVHVSERKLLSCAIRPLAYGIKPQLSGNTVSFDLDRPRYLVMFFNDEPAFNNTGLMLFAEPPEKNAPRPGDPGVANIMDYKVDNTGRTLETAKINQAIVDVSARPGGGVLYFPKGVYLTGTILMKSNVRLYVAADALIRGSRKNADYVAAPTGGGGRDGMRGFVVFDNVENASLEGPGALDMEGYPWLWHDFQPDTATSGARDDVGKVNDPHGTGVRGYVINNSRNITFEGLRLLRSAYWTVNVFNSEHFTTRNVKIINRKQQYHDDAYDFNNSRHILIENGFSMTMDDAFAMYGGGGGGGGRGGARGGARGNAATSGTQGRTWGIEDLVVKGYVDYGYTSALAVGYGGAPAMKGLRFEDVHFVSTHNKFAIWIQLTPAYFTGRGYSSGARPSRNAALDDFRFVNCSFESDGGQVYIDGGDLPLTNFSFENCTFYKAGKPGLIMGKNVAPVLFKNVTMNGAVLKQAEQLKGNAFDLLVPARFEQ